jgi:hypothetical protein
MPLWVPQKGILRTAHNMGPVATTSAGAVAQTHATVANTKGAPVEIFASTPFDTFWVKIIASRYSLSAAAAAGALDILVGPSVEDRLIANLLMGYAGGNSTNQICGPKMWDFPLYIPGGTRVACAVAGALLATNVVVQMFLYGGNVPFCQAGGKVTTYGITDASVPNGTAFTPGATGVEGAWQQIVAATSEDHFALVPSFSPRAITSLNDKWCHLDIGIGAAAAEDQIAEGYQFYTQASEQCGGPWNSMPCFGPIPSGSRLSIRASLHAALDTGGYDAALHAVT